MEQEGDFALECRWYSFACVLYMHL